MSMVYEERSSDSPYVETVMHGWTVGDGSSVRPAEPCWHMVVVKHNGEARLLVVGPWREAGVASWGKGAELLWIKFKLGTFMPHRPTRSFLDVETILPGAARGSFWLKDSAWQLPVYDNVELFVEWLARDGVLLRDPVVEAALQEQLPEMAERTVRHRFLRATGLSQGHIRQVERAKRAAALLEQSVSILDTVYEAGYFDQSHLTRSLKRFVGHTPAQLLRIRQPE